MHNLSRRTVLRGAAVAALAAMATPALAQAAAPFLPATEPNILTQSTLSALPVVGAIPLPHPVMDLPLKPVSGEVLPPSFSELLERLDPTLSVDTLLAKFHRVFTEPDLPSSAVRAAGQFPWAQREASWITTLVDRPEFLLQRRMPYAATMQTLGMRYTGVRRGLSSAVSAVGAITQEEGDGLLELAEKGERTLLWGDRRILDAGGAEVVADGLVRQAAGQGMVIDAQGVPFTPALIEQAIARMQAVAPIAAADWRVEAIVAPASLAHYTQPIEENPFGYDSPHGFVPIFSSLFMERVDGGGPLIGTVDPAGAPPMPTILACRGFLLADTSPRALAGRRPYYWVSSFNQHNESRAAAVTPASDGNLSGWNYGFFIEPTSGALGYRVYRHTTNDLAAAGIIDEIPAQSGPIAWTDRGEWLPNTDIALVYNRDPRDVVIERLSPLLKAPLVKTSVAEEFLLLNYSRPLIKTAGRAIIIKNIGRG